MLATLPVSFPPEIHPHNIRFMVLFFFLFLAWKSVICSYLLWMPYSGYLRRCHQCLKELEIKPYKSLIQTNVPFLLLPVGIRCFWGNVNKHSIQHRLSEMSSGCLISHDSPHPHTFFFFFFSVSNKVTITSVSDWTISKGWSRIFLLSLFFWSKDRAASASDSFHSLGHVNYREGLFILKHLQPLQHFCFVCESYENKNLPSDVVSHLMSLICGWSADRTCWYHNKIHNRCKCSPISVWESNSRRNEKVNFSCSINRHWTPDKNILIIVRAFFSGNLSLYVKGRNWNLINK